MQLPLQKEIRRYLKKMRRRKYQRRRRAAFFLLAGAFVYLGWVGSVRDAFYAVSEDWTVEYALPSKEEGEEDVFRLELHLKTGEILFFREQRRIHKTDP